MTSMTPGRRATCARPRRTTAAERPELLDVEVIGGALPRVRVEEAVAYAAASAGIEEGHVAIEFVGRERIAELNEGGRSQNGATPGLPFSRGEEDGGPPGGGGFG